MANLDTENKRRCAVGIVGLWNVLPVADGTVGQPDRQHAAGMYCCISAGEAVVSWTSSIMQGLDVISGNYVYIVGKYRAT